MNKSSTTLTNWLLSLNPDMLAPSTKTVKLERRAKKHRNEGQSAGNLCSVITFYTLRQEKSKKSKDESSIVGAARKTRKGRSKCAVSMTPLCETQLRLNRIQRDERKQKIDKLEKDIRKMKSKREGGF